MHYDHWDRDPAFIYIEVPRSAVKILVPMGWEEVGIKDERVPAFLRKSRDELFHKYQHKARKAIFPPRRTNGF